MSVHVDKELVIGALALELRFVSRRTFAAALAAWKSDATRSLTQILAEDFGLAPAHVALLEAMAASESASPGAASQPGALRDTSHLGETDAPRGAEHDPPPLGEGVDDDRYRTLRLHASGGLGQVFLARDVQLHRDVALKEIRDEQADDPLSRQRFVLEAELTGRLEHPGIVPVYALGFHADGRPYYSMRFVEGETLQEAILRFHDLWNTSHDARQRMLDLRGLLRRFIDVCNAVAYAHSRGILHRDLKPSNIMLGPYGETLVLDWGLAKLIGSAEATDPAAIDALSPRTAEIEPTLEGAALGTLGYMSPEQAAGRQAELSGATDVYSLGATLYAILAGKPPLDANDRSAARRRVVAGEIPALTDVTKRAPAPLAAVCARALALQPADRYATPLAPAADVERWLADEPVAAYNEPLVARLGRLARRHRAMTRALGAALLVTTIAAVVAALVTNAARRDAVRAEQQAESGFRKAREAVDTYFTKVSEHRLLHEPGLQPLRRELLQAALNYYQGFVAERRDDPTAHLALADAHARLGEIHRTLGDRAAAQQSLETASALYAAIEAREMHNPDYWRHRARAHVVAGAHWVGEGRADRALREYQQGIAAHERIRGDGAARDEDQRQKAHLDLDRGLVLVEQGRLAEGIESATQGRDTLRGLAARRSEIEFMLSLARAQDTLAQIYRDAGQSAEAIAAAHENVALCRQASEKHPRWMQLKCDQAESYATLGTCYTAALDMASAIEAYQQSVTRWQELADENPAVPSHRAALAKQLSHLSIAQEQSGQLAEAAATEDRAIKTLEALLAEQPTAVEYQRELAGALHRRANTQYRAGDLAGATQSCRSAEERYRTLCQQQPNDLRAWDGWHVAIHLLGDLYGEQQQLTEELAARQTQLDIGRALVRMAPEIPRHHWLLAESLWVTAQTRSLLQLPLGESIALAEKALATLERLVNEFPGDERFQESLSQCCLILGNLSAESRDLAAAERRYARTRELQSELQRRQSLGFDPRTLAAAWIGSGRAALNRGDQAAARIAFDSAAAAAPEDPAAMLEAARGWASCAAIVDDPAERDKCLARCVEILRIVHGAGVPLAELLGADPEFTAVRGLPDVQELLAAPADPAP